MESASRGGQERLGVECLFDLMVDDERLVLSPWKRFLRFVYWAVCKTEL